MKSFRPIVGQKPKVLILGSMPSEKSLKEKQYYAHPQNAFWWIMSHMLRFQLDIEYQEKVSKLQSAGIAVWDVLYSCQRQGSLDSNIVRISEKPNDLVDFLRVHKTISLIAFNGGAAKTIAKRHHSWLLNKYNTVQLPSTSPAHASISKQDKYQVWAKEIFQHIELE